MTAPGFCGCGCGEQTENGSRFRSGHNARLRDRKPIEHGTSAGYRRGCRCDACRDAHRVANMRLARARGVLPFPEAMRRRRKPPRIVLPRHEWPIWRRLQDAIEIDARGCWIWQKAKSPGGYGRIGMPGGGPIRQTHRVSYETFVGPIPEGLHIDHLCRNRACINPEHLEAVTQAENNRRANAIRWGTAS